MNRGHMSERKRGREPTFRDVAHVLEKDACVLCSMLKRFHSACIQNADVKRVQALCDFHAWAIAGAGDMEEGARVFLRLLDQTQFLQTSVTATPCSICERVAEEEIECSRRFVDLLDDSEFQTWLRGHGAVCIPHARRLLKRIPDGHQQFMINLIHRAAAKLRDELHSIADHPDNRHSPTVLSRAAEYLKGRRGLALKI